VPFAVSRRKQVLNRPPEPKASPDPMIVRRMVKPMLCAENSVRSDYLTEWLTSAAMIALLCFFLTLFASPFKPKTRLEAENAALRHQLIILWRKVRGHVRITDGDRLFLVLLYRWFPTVLNAITIIRSSRDPRPLAGAAPLGLGVLIALGGILVMMSYLSE
jgi:hypothetical protein